MVHRLRLEEDGCAAFQPNIPLKKKNQLKLSGRVQRRKVKGLQRETTAVRGMIIVRMLWGKKRSS